jgi:hypothetical protein
MDIDVAHVGNDVVFGWDSMSSHDLHHHDPYADGRVSLRYGPALLQLDLLPASARPSARRLPVIARGEFRRLLWQIAREVQEVPVASAPSTPTQLPQGPQPQPIRRNGRGPSTLITPLWPPLRMHSCRQLAPG